MKMKDLFLSRKRNERTETLSLIELRGVIERTLFRWGVIVRWKWMNLRSSWKLGGQYESNSDAFADACADAFADAFADGKNFLLVMQLMLSIVTIYSYMHENRCVEVWPSFLGLLCYLSICSMRGKWKVLRMINGRCYDKWKVL